MLTITERQGYMQWDSDYTYVGMDNGYHVFADAEGKRELFAKRRSVAGWHIVRGQWCYEFVRSA